MARVNLRNGRDIGCTVIHSKTYLRIGLHQGIGLVIYGLFARNSIYSIVCIPARSRYIELSDVCIYRGRGVIRHNRLTLIRLHRHRTHYTIIQPTTQGDEDDTSARVGILIGSRLRHNLNLGDILRTQILHIIDQRLAREFYFTIIDKELRACRAIDSDVILLHPHARRLTQKFQTIATHGSLGIGYIHHEAVGLTANHLRLDNHILNLGRRLLECHNAHISILGHSNLTLVRLIAHALYQYSICAIGK